MVPWKVMRKQNHKEIISFSYLHRLYLSMTMVPGVDIEVCLIYPWSSWNNVMGPWIDVEYIVEIMLYSHGYYYFYLRYYKISVFY